MSCLLVPYTLSDSDPSDRKQAEEDVSLLAPIALSMPTLLSGPFHHLV